MAETDLYKVKLINSGARREQVHFDVTPDFNETINVNYRAIDPIHAPGQIYTYVNTASRTFNINATFISRNVNEADLNLDRLWLLRGWTQSAFGTSTLTDVQRRNRDLIRQGSRPEAGPQEQFIADSEGAAQSSATRNELSDVGAELRGRPPAVLLLSAYARPGSLGNTAEHINRVPVVMEQLSIPLPSDKDYINTSTGVPMPTIMTLDMTLKETHSPSEYNRFNLFSYKRGTLRNF